MRNPQPFSPTKESAARRAALMQGAGRLSPRALDRITVASAVRHTYSAGSAYDTVDYDSLDEDTIEMVLSPEDMQLLSRAAEEALAEIRAGRVAAAAPIAAPTPVEAPIAAERPAASEIRMPEKTAGAPSIAMAPSATTARPATAQTSRAAVTSPPPSRVSRWSPVRMLGTIGAIAVAAVALASIAHHTTPTVAPVTAPVSMQPSTPAPAPAQATQLPAPTLAAKAPAESDSSAPAPVRIKNPFDHSEVFEFPAGTSSETAHQSVADILMQRARERGIQPLHPVRAIHAN